MKTISILSQKGGAGKTTLATHLAVAAQVDGAPSSIIDLDPQATARKWWGRRRSEPMVTSDHAELLGPLIEAARVKKSSLLVIDTAPNADRASLIAAKIADLILIPCRPATFDLDAIHATLQLAAFANKPAYVVINAAPIRSRVTQEAQEALLEAGAKLCPVVLHQRVAFSHATVDGRTALEFEPDGAAAGEIRALYEWTRTV
jgi:chromosome partitioning protein